MTMYCNLLFADFSKVQSFGVFYLFRWLAVDKIINRKKIAMMKLHNCEHPDGRAEEQGETRRRCHESEKYKQIDISLKKLQKGKKMKKNLIIDTNQYVDWWWKIWLVRTLCNSKTCSIDFESHQTIAEMTRKKKNTHNIDKSLPTKHANWLFPWNVCPYRHFPLKHLVYAFRPLLDYGRWWIFHMQII